MTSTHGEPAALNDLLRLEGVSKSFGGVAAVREFSLAVAEGEAKGLIGPNGAGKTTLFDLISGTLRADAGRIVFGGADVTGLKPHRRASLGMSRTFQLTRPFPRMSVADNVLVGRVFGGSRRAGTGTAAEEASELLDQVSLLGKADLLAGSLTLAEQRRLELARALATMPRLLMLDEVMAGLTQGERAAMVELIRRVASERGLAMIVSEHVMDAMVDLCDTVVVMSRGIRLIEGETKSVLGSEEVAEVYLGTGTRKACPDGRAKPAEAGG